MADRQAIATQKRKVEQDTPSQETEPQKDADGALNDTDLASVAGGVPQFRNDAVRLSTWRQNAV